MCAHCVKSLHPVHEELITSSAILMLCTLWGCEKELSAVGKHQEVKMKLHKVLGCLKAAEEGIKE